jgi:ATP-binding cassette subfamily B protein
VSARAKSAFQKEPTRPHVTHRLSNVKCADFVLVQRGGRVAAFGLHDDLLTADGYYAELFRGQACAYA